MPQTREHFEICRLLGIGHGIVVITKRDLVDPEAFWAALDGFTDFLAEELAGELKVKKRYKATVSAIESVFLRPTKGFVERRLS